MTSVEIPRFPRGFIFAEEPVAPPPTYIQGPLLSNFWVHSWTNVETAGDDELFVVIIGHAVPTTTDHGSDPASTLLKALEHSECEFFRTLGKYSGRHAVIFGSPGNLSVVNDATGMRSVFYAVQGGIIASHAQLVERALVGPHEQSKLPFRYGYPGNRTPYPRTRILTPNTYYWMSANLVRRFWPVTRPTPTTIDEAASHLLEASTVALRHMAEDRRVRVALTAGLDSRAILAVALNAGIDFTTYTYGRDRGSKVDRLLARDLAAKYNVIHTPVEKRIDDPALIESLRESNYAFHHAPWVGALRDHFEHPTEVAVIGNLLEIGRSNYMPARRAGAPAPANAYNMARLHHRKVGAKVKAEIEEYGHDQFFKESVSGFQGFIEETGFDITKDLLDPFDQFYWEHRMGTWQGVAMGERDFYAEAFIPFNARSVFESMLGVSEIYRRKDTTVLKMIELVDEGLLDVPVNPNTWPIPTTNGS